MIFQVRQGVFETNSSSTHTLTICSKDDFDKWKHGEVFWLDNDWHKLDTNKNFVTPEELKQLDVKNLVPRDKWDMFYMGDEGSSTMYVDMVNREFAANSTSETRYPLLDNIEDMLKVIHQEKKEKDID